MGGKKDCVAVVMSPKKCRIQIHDAIGIVCPWCGCWSYMCLFVQLNLFLYEVFMAPTYSQAILLEEPPWIPCLPRKTK